MGSGFKAPPGAINAAASTLEGQASQLAKAMGRLGTGMKVDTGDGDLDAMIQRVVAEAGQSLTQAGEALLADSGKLSACAQNYAKTAGEINPDLIRKSLQVVVGQL